MDFAFAVSATWQTYTQSSRRHKDKFGPAASVWFHISLCEETYNTRYIFYRHKSRTPRTKSCSRGAALRDEHKMRIKAQTRGDRSSASKRGDSSGGGAWYWPAKRTASQKRMETRLIIPIHQERK